MSDQFEELMATASDPAGTAFATAFRGYDKEEVDRAFSNLSAKLRAHAQQIALLDEHLERADVAAGENGDRIERLEAEVAAAAARAAEAEERAAGLDDAVSEATADAQDTIERLRAELTAAEARVTDADNRMEALTEELATATDETPGRHKFEEVLRVAEEQASVLLRNAGTQGERLLAAASDEIVAKRRDAQADAEAIVSQAEHDAQQIRLRIDTELTAHEARIEREAAHADEKVAQAEQEAAAIRSEAEKGAAALRSLVARETSQARTEAEDAVRELRLRAVEFEESLTRRQDDAQQEFLALHNQAVAHADRITQDANDQVANSVEHSKRVSAKAEDFERLMRAQAHQIEADAQVRAREKLDRASDKAQHIIDTVVAHSQRCSATPRTARVSCAGSSSSSRASWPRSRSSFGPRRRRPRSLRSRPAPRTTTPRATTPPDGSGRSRGGRAGHRSTCAASAITFGRSSATARAGNRRRT